MTDPILITGCSTGMGRAAALALVQRGHTVYATARDTTTLTELAEAGAHILPIDVTDEESMRSAVDTIEKAHGAIGTLINNAGYSQAGPVELVQLDAARQQFEANVFGLARMCQLVLPAMREAGKGRIVNISSMGGRMVLPTGGWYHASKYAVEALSDALRVEVRPFGIHVVLIEPGAIKTEWDGTAVANARSAGGPPYAALVAANARVFSRAYGSFAASAARAARTYVKAVEAKRPRHRYLITVGARGAVSLRHFFGSRVWDAGTSRVWGWR